MKFEPADGWPPLVMMNRMGRTSNELNEVNRLFVDFAPRARAPVLDIGSGYGIAALAAFDAGARVIANDVDLRHLEIIRAKAPHPIETIAARFPDDLDFPPASLGAIHAANILHFLTGEELLLAARKMHEWLRPGGKVFTITGTPYVRTLEAFIPTYKQRKRSGQPWPGEIANVREWSTHPTIDELPDFVHFLDDETVSIPFAAAGFIIEKVEMFERRNLPEYLAYEGRENVALVAAKPSTPQSFGSSLGST